MHAQYALHDTFTFAEPHVVVMRDRTPRTDGNRAVVVDSRSHSPRTRRRSAGGCSLTHTAPNVRPVDRHIRSIRSCIVCIYSIYLSTYARDGVVFRPERRRRRRRGHLAERGTLERSARIDTYLFRAQRRIRHTHVHMRSAHMSFSARLGSSVDTHTHAAAAVAAAVVGYL